MHSAQNDGIKIQLCVTTVELSIFSYVEVMKKVNKSLKVCCIKLIETSASMSTTTSTKAMIFVLARRVDLFSNKRVLFI